MMLTAEELQQLTANAAFFCNLAALDMQERGRHIHLTEQLRTSIVESRELRSGFEFKLAASISLGELVEWVFNESKCCPFFDFTVNLQPHGSGLWLKLEGRDGVKPFIKAELNF